ncbi:copper chaperone PCu(A)C [Leucobacter sp. G161]|uniref:copper chaperone PCu(A)C n=1 Tax=Leucobacter sp. G161 TaxID=663704 RepID=UPI0009FA66A2|nr:copper chaperone PCu(A)C [Leucobacter sp. G161]
MLHLEHGWVRAGRDDVTGFFGTLHNSSGLEITVRGGRSPAANAVELHDIIQQHDGRKQMTQLANGITIPAQGSITLAPGGLHGMLIGLDHRLNDGERVQIALETNTAHVELTLTARRRPPTTSL